MLKILALIISLIPALVSADMLLSWCFTAPTEREDETPLVAGEITGFELFVSPSPTEPVADPIKEIFPTQPGNRVCRNYYLPTDGPHYITMKTLATGGTEGEILKSVHSFPPLCVTADPVGQSVECEAPSPPAVTCQ